MEANLQALRAELAQTQAALAHSNQQIAAISAAQDALRLAAQTEIAQSEARSAALIAQMAQRGGGGGGDKFDMVDFKAVQPGNFKGRREESWKLWSRAFKTYCNTRKTGFRRALDWAEACHDPVDHNHIDAMGWEHARVADQKLYDFLELTCREDALVMVEKFPDMGF